MNTKLIIYWVVTGMLALIMLFSGIGALAKLEFLVESMYNISFPLYVANILGIAYVLSAIAIVIPGIPWIKEWAYAGIVFAMTGAFASHVFIGDTFANMVPPLVILALAIVSYKLRPSQRRIITNHTEK